MTSSVATLLSFISTLGLACTINTFYVLGNQPRLAPALPWLCAAATAATAPLAYGVAIELAYCRLYTRKRNPERCRNRYDLYENLR
jgi:hypothetical protein